MAGRDVSLYSANTQRIQLPPVLKSHNVHTILKASTRNNVSVDREYDGAWRSPSGDMPKSVSSLYHHVSCHPERIWVGGRLVSSAV